MSEHHSNHSIHGMPLQFHSKHSALTDPAESFLRYFPEQPSNGSEPMQITFHAINHWDDFPVALPSSISGPGAQGQDRVIDLEHTKERRKFYVDPDHLILENPDQGYRVLLQERQGLVNAYFVRPDRLAPEHQMRLLQFSLSCLLNVRGYITLHATALEKNGRAILIPGNSGRGKTTAFISLLRSGYCCLSDDHPLLHENGKGVEILPFPEKVDVTDGTIELFPELQQAGSLLYPGMRKRFFFVEEMYPHGTGTTSQPGLILFPEVLERQTSALEPISGTRALDHLLRGSYLSRDSMGWKQEFQILSRLVNQSACYRLLFGQDVLDLPKLIDPLLVTC